MQTYPTLYSRDATGNIRVWWMERDGSRYRTVAGIKDGEMVHSEWRQAFAMNIGRSNATTPEQQADREVKSAYEKKLRMKYHESENNVDQDKYFKPMLAQDYTKRYTNKNKSLSFPVHTQPKLDGIRCIVTAEGAWSRTGKPIVAVPHILKSLAPLFENDPNLVLDGELYNHELNHDFNKITSVVRKLDPTSKQLSESEELIQYHVYDCPSMDGNFSDRVSVLREVLETVSYHVVLVDTQSVDDQHTLDELYSAYMEAGYEGQMIRLSGTYEQKRSNTLLKRKEFQDAEYEIVRIEEGQGNWSGYAKRVVCRLTDGREFGSSLKGNQEYALKVLQNADVYIGKQATVRYQNLTPDGVPRFPIAHALHLEDRW